MEADNEQNVLILPDGSMAVATKIKKQEKAQLICWHCRTTLSYEKGAETVKCGVCGSFNGTTMQAAQSQYVMYRCGGCNTILRAPRNSVAVSCAN